MGQSRASPPASGTYCAAILTRRLWSQSTRRATLGSGCLGLGLPLLFFLVRFEFRHHAGKINHVVANDLQSVDGLFLALIELHHARIGGGGTGRLGWLMGVGLAEAVKVQQRRCLRPATQLQIFHRPATRQWTHSQHKAMGGNQRANTEHTS